MSSENTVAMLLSIFSIFGRPLEIRSDSGPAFRNTYEAAMVELGIDVQFSSAYHPEGNGMAEQAVSRWKMAIKKNGLGVGNQKLQDLVSSLNNQSSSVPGAGLQRRPEGWIYDHKDKKYSILGSIEACHPSSDSVIRSFTLKLDSDILRWIYASWIRAIYEEGAQTETQS